VGGFYIAALIKAGRMDEAEHQLVKLAEVNQLGNEGEWEFNEWCHGRTGQPMGYPHQAWSAGMYLFASHCVSTKAVPLLSQSLKVQQIELDHVSTSPIPASMN
jgi:glycogen debranching enzyme